MTQQQTTFVQLTTDDCKYLLDLINEIDLDTEYTAKQRSYTIPKLIRIQENPQSCRLAFQDTRYLLELVDDDDLEDCEQQREMTRLALETIKNLQTNKFSYQQSVQQQRDARKSKRIRSMNSNASALQEHFTRA